MNQETIDKLAKGIKIFGAILGVVCVVGLIWSMCH